MDTNELRQRTKQFALRAMRLAEALPNTKSGRTIANQLVRSGTSVGANYRAACKARSRAEFISKMGTVEEEADESAFWMELIIEAAMLAEQRVRTLWKEADELVAIMAASRNTASKNGRMIKNNRHSAVGNRQ